MAQEISRPTQSSFAVEYSRDSRRHRQMTTLPYTFWCHHLTRTEGLKWRQQDWDSRIIVRGLKQEDFKGELRLSINGKNRTYDNKNIEQFIDILLPLVGRKLREDVKAPISIVPIPNSGMAVGERGPFRTVELAQKLAKGFGDGAQVVPAIWWNKV